MSPSLDSIKKLADDILNVPDDRPIALKIMPSANDEGQTQFARYYRFFYEYVRLWKPDKMLEIGTYKATACGHMAYENEVKVVTLDIDPDAARIVKILNMPNLIAVTGDSAALAPAMKLIGPFDVIFIDANHTFNNCYGEYIYYRPMAKPGGIIFFDDIHLGSEMEVAWEYIPDPKVELPTLHYTGFGACMVNPNITPKPWADVITEATAKWKARMKA